MQGDRRDAYAIRTKAIGSTTLLVDPDASSRALLRSLLESSGLCRAVVSTDSVANVPLGEITDQPLTVVLSSEVAQSELALLGPLLADTTTYVVLVLRSLAPDQLSALQGTPADAMVYAEDLRGPEAGRLLTPGNGHALVSVSSEVLRQLLHLASGDRADSVRRPRLTDRETQTLIRVANGLSNRQIARDMGITEHGVKRHVANILAKLNCQNRTTAVAVALRSGLIEAQTLTAGAN
ncbi:response regulator transcription factor [Streptomyces sp. NPDC048172]|uniref:response regulator transcription factor n=1 Tax=Streptomyces sp. NPDC048172 TaxID=3365505 RepID=UPI00371E5A9C